jgi:rare lipoprotein A (peptidoglycan hydrolase)
MRYLLPALAAAAVVAIGAVPAAAEPTSKRPPTRGKSHVSLHLSSHTVLDSDSLALRGMVRPRARRRVKIVVRGARPEVLTLATKRNGTFALRWRPPRVGSYRVRAYTVHSRRARAAASVARRLTAYDRAVASYYGPGLYGGTLACGGTLQPGTLGVAHKTLPCGARVKLRYHSRSLTVRVVDRGPYAAGRDFDLTEATKARLRFPDLGVLLVSRGG